MLVTPALDQDVQHDAALIHRPPEPVPLARDLHANLVQVPGVSSTGQPATDLVGECLAELQAPLPHRLMADRDAARGEDLIHMTQAQRKAEIEPDRMADDLRGEAMTGIAGAGGGSHPTRLREPVHPG